jgi:DNA transposition AAA+ family ATPase
MAPELYNSIEAEELKDIVRRVREIQLARKWSDGELLRRCSALGSTKTYKNILAAAEDPDQSEKFKELKLDKWLTEYTCAIKFLEAMGQEDAGEKIYTDMEGPLELKRVFLETSNTNSIARFIPVLGDTGMGKTFCKKALLEMYGMRCLEIKASVSWNDRPSAMWTSILKAQGRIDIPLSAYEKEEKGLEKFNELRKALLIEEGHHLGPSCLNTLKTIINESPGEVVIFAMPPLWARLERTAYEEARQLTRNRLAERIRLRFIEEDVKIYLKGKLDLSGADMKKAVEEAMRHAPALGYFGFLRQVCARTIWIADGEAVTFETFSRAMTHVRGCR